MNQTLTVSQLRRISEETMAKNGFITDFPSAAFDQLDALHSKRLSDDESIKDLRNLLWSSIDNDSSKDLDQIEYAEELPNGDIRLLVGIADVDEYIQKDTPIDKIAKHQTVSVYTETKILPMLPREISEDLTSLLPNVDRLAIVIEMLIKENGDVPEHSVYRAMTHNYAKLTYEEVGEWIDEKSDEPEEFSEIGGLREQIELQLKTAKRLHEFRKLRGSLEFESIESIPVFDGEDAKDLRMSHTNSAKKIIENFMVAANVEMAEFLESKNFTSIRRIVKTPARWEGIRDIANKYGVDLPIEPESNALSEFLRSRKIADPEHFPDLSLSIVKLIGSGDYVVQKPNEEGGGHFGLALRDYTHSTAPNRRFPDLIVQRMVKAALKGEKSPYSDEDLTEIADQCNERETAAKKVERKMRKVIAASVMHPRIGEVFEAIVTGINSNGTFARILRPPVDGRIVEGENEVRIGQKIKVKLLDTSVENGFIDFGYRK